MDKNLSTEYMLWTSFSLTPSRVNSNEFLVIPSTIYFARVFVRMFERGAGWLVSWHEVTVVEEERGNLDASSTRRQSDDVEHVEYASFNSLRRSQGSLSHS